MPTYEITSPDGKTYDVTAPDGATEDEVMAYAQGNWKQLSSVTPDRPTEKAQVSESPSAKMETIYDPVSGMPLGEQEAPGKLPSETAKEEWLTAEAGRLSAINPKADQGILKQLAESRYVPPDAAKASPVDRIRQYTDKGMGVKNAGVNAGFDESLQKKINNKFQKAKPDERGDRIGVSYNPNTAEDDAAKQAKEIEQSQEWIDIHDRAKEFGPVVSGFIKAGGQLNAFSYGTAAFVADALGADTVKKWGADGAQDMLRRVGAVGLAKEFTDLETREDVATYLAETLSYGATQAAIAISTGLAGSAIKGSIGATIALATQNVSQEIGSIYIDAQEEAARTGKPAAPLWQIAAGAITAAAVDTAGDKFGLSSLGKAGFKGNVLTRLAKSMGSQAAVQGGTEMAQKVFEESGAGKDPFRDGITKDYINEGAAGAVMGGGPGIVGARHSQQSIANNEIADAINSAQFSQEGNAAVVSDVLRTEGVNINPVATRMAPTVEDQSTIPQAPASAPVAINPDLQSQTQQILNAENNQGVSNGTQATETIQAEAQRPQEQVSYAQTQAQTIQPEGRALPIQTSLAAELASLRSQGSKNEEQNAAGSGSDRSAESVSYGVQGGNPQSIDDPSLGQTSAFTAGTVAPAIPSSNGAKLSLAPTATTRDFMLVRNQLSKARKVEIVPFSGKMNDSQTAASALANMLGRTLTFYDAKSGNNNFVPNGMADPIGKNILIHSKSTDSPLAVMVHESVHLMPKEILTPLKTGLNAVFKGDMREAFAKEFNYDLSNNEIMNEEIPAFIAQAISSKSEFWSELNKQMGNKDFSAVAKHILNSLAKIIGSAKSNYGQDFLDKYVANIPEAQRLLSDAYVKAMQAQGLTPDASIVVRPQKKVTGGESARNRLNGENPFMSFLATHGINILDRSDVGGEKGKARLIAGHGPLFRKNGLRLDDLAIMAHEEGFITDAQINDDSDNGGVNALSEMIGRALSNEVVAAESSDSTFNADGSLIEFAHSVGIDTTGKTADEVYDAVQAYSDAEEQTRIDAEYSHAQELLNDLTNEEFEARNEKSLNDLIDELKELENVEGNGSVTGQSEETISSSRSTEETTAKQEGGIDRGTSQETFNLNSESAEEARAKLEKQEKSEKAVKSEQSRLEESERQTRNKKDIASRQDASAENFQLGQSTDDSLSGQGAMFSNKAQTDSAAFKKWFGDSKVVDSDGNPLVVYHGTDKSFNKFNTKKATQGIIWFAGDRTEIDSGDIGAQGSGKVMELFASIKNPAGWKEYDQLGIDELRGRGYDGVLLPEKDGTFVGFAFDSNQFKDANRNNGNFDGSNPDIRFSNKSNKSTNLNQDITLEIPLEGGGKAKLTINAQSAIAKLDEREDALRMVKECLL